MNPYGECYNFSEHNIDYLSDERLEALRKCDCGNLKDYAHHKECFNCAEEREMAELDAELDSF